MSGNDARSGMADAVEWAVSGGLVPYPDAVAAMEQRAAAISERRAGELVWLLEHPPVYTAGTSAKAGDLIAPDRFPVFRTGRGGQYTYHGPGQRVIYLMLDLKTRGRDVHKFVETVEGLVIDALAALGVTGERRKGRVGVWVARQAGEEKIAAVGIRLRHWVSFHGASLNVAPDLSHYGGIVPCGISAFGVTSLAALGLPHEMGAVDRALRVSFERRFGATVDASPPVVAPVTASAAQ